MRPPTAVAWLFLAAALAGCRTPPAAETLRSQQAAPTEAPATLTPAPAPTPRAAAGTVAYVRAGDLWVKELPNGAPRQLTRDGGNHTPRWSRSGQWLAFWKEAQVWVVRATGADARPLDPRPGKNHAWSPTADDLAYTTADELLVVRADGCEVRLLGRRAVIA
jgi:hypothetical protein